MKKRLLTALLAMTMVMGMSVGVMADGADAGATPSTPTYTDNSTITFTKNYVLTNANTTSPKETFEFSIVAESVTDAAAGVTKDNMPIPTVGTVEYGIGEASIAPGTSKDVTITLPGKCQCAKGTVCTELAQPNAADADAAAATPRYTVFPGVGVYTYKITEKKGNKTGVTYYSDPIKLVVTVLQDASGTLRVAGVHTEQADTDAKSDKFPNVYSAGNLDITQKVEGNLADPTKEFDVEVTFTKPNGTEPGKTITYTENGVQKEIKPEDWKDNKVTVKITPKDGETVTFEDLPYDVTYTVVETKEGDYTAPTYDPKEADGQTTGDGTINSPQETDTITVTKNATVDTGIFLNNMPYIIIAAIVACGFAVLLFGRRREEER